MSPNGTIRTCPSCSHPCPWPRRFCGACGASAVKYCGRCHFDNSAEDRYCGLCGFTLEASVTVTVTGPQARVSQQVAVVSSRPPRQDSVVAKLPEEPAPQAASPKGSTQQLEVSEVFDVKELAADAVTTVGTSPTLEPAEPPAPDADAAPETNTPPVIDDNDLDSLVGRLMSLNQGVTSDKEEPEQAEGDSDDLGQAQIDELFGM